MTPSRAADNAKSCAGGYESGPLDRAQDGCPSGRSANQPKVVLSVVAKASHSAAIQSGAGKNALRSGIELAARRAASPAYPRVAQRGGERTMNHASLERSVLSVR
jgi:hypothetical protein